MKLNSNELQVFEQVPNGWAVAPLGEVLPILYGKGLTKATRDETGNCPVYGSSGQVGVHSKSLTKKPTLIIGRKGSVGEVHYSKVPCWPIDTVYFVEENDELDLKFFKYLLRGLKLSRLDKSTAVPGLSRDDYNSVEVAVAPLEQQKRIVAEIENQFSRLDEAVANLKRVKANLKRYKAAVLKAAVEGKLTKEWRKQHPDVEPASKLLERVTEKRNEWIKVESAKGNNEAKRLTSKLKKHKFTQPENIELPESWKWASFVTASQLVVDCHNKTAPYEENGISLVRTTNVRDSKLDLDTVKYVSQETYEYWSRRCPPKPGDILFTREAPMGEAAIIPEDTTLCMGQRMMLIRLFSELINNKYFLYAILEPRFQSVFSLGAVGMGVKHLRVGDVESLVIPIPPIYEQIQIVEEVESRLSVADEIIKETENNLHRAERLRQSILRKAFSGSLFLDDLMKIKGAVHG